MSEEQKRLLEKQLWAVANVLRGKMNADEYKNYILGFIFYKYLSEKLERYVNKKLLARDKITFAAIKENTKEGEEYIEHIEAACIGHLGFFLRPTEIFSYLVRKGKGSVDEHKTFILEDLKNILNNIEETSMGTASEDDFKGLFADVDLTSSKLGSSENKKNDVIVEVLSLLNGIDFKLEDSKSDLLGDAYEYLIGEFAAGAGKKGGEFYTPAQVSRLLAQIVSVDKKRLRSVFDPTCGSGSLLLRLRDYTEVMNYYGQELNRTTFNLVRMNMILHGIHFDHFKIHQGDTLTDDMHPDLKAEAVVANPPFSAEWKGEDDPQLAHDERFSQYGRLAPKKKADYAFITHMLYHLSDNGTMAIVLPHGVLFRGGAEERIRKYIIEKQNYLDAVIGLPANLFFGTGIPASILVFKKCRKDDEDVLFINASKEFKKEGNKNNLTDENIAKIFDVYRNRKEIKKYSHRVLLKEIKENEYNLNIPRYVESFDEPAIVDIHAVSKKLTEIKHIEETFLSKIGKHCRELGLPKLEGNNLYCLKEYKKGVMQKLFSQQVRFKNKDGKNYTNWAKMPLNQIFIQKKGAGISKEDVISSGKNKCILYGELYTTYSEIIREVKSRTNLTTRVRSMVGDLLVPCSTTTTAIDLVNITELREENVLIGGDITILRFKDKGCGTFYAYYLTHFKTTEIAKYGQGSTIVHLYFEHFKNVIVDFPEIEEQQKIADFLLSIESLIEMNEWHALKS